MSGSGNNQNSSFATGNTPGQGFTTMYGRPITGTSTMAQPGQYMPYQDPEWLQKGLNASSQPLQNANVQNFGRWGYQNGATNGYGMTGGGWPSPQSLFGNVPGQTPGQGYNYQTSGQMPGGPGASGLGGGPTGIQSGTGPGASGMGPTGDNFNPGAGGTGTYGPGGYGPYPPGVHGPQPVPGHQQLSAASPQDAAYIASRLGSTARVSADPSVLNSAFSGADPVLMAQQYAQQGYNPSSQLQQSVAAAQQAQNNKPMRGHFGYQARRGLLG